MRDQKIVSCAAALIILATPAFGFDAKVVGVLDGDTVEVLHDNKPERIRLNGIDCPEKSQAFGRQAKEFTSDLCFGKIVEVQSHGHDRYGRTIGEIILSNGKDLNHELVAAGLAWWYKKYASDNKVLEQLEEKARREKRGLWFDENPTAPWDYRHRKKH